MQRARVLLARLAGPALVCAALLAPLAAHWLAGRTLVWSDTQDLYAPQRWIVDEALRAFRLPLWNPYAGAGMPFLADGIHGVLHPVSVLTAWLGTTRSADLLIGGYVLCAGLGSALLARELGASRAGAAVAAFTYGMSGYVLSMAGNLVFLAGAGSLPFCVAGLRRFAADPRAGSLAMGVAGTTVLALTGDAQALMVGGGLALALAWEAAGWRGALRAVAAGCVGLLVAGAQLVPTAVHVPRTDRTAALWVRTPLVWSFAPWRMPELLVPGLFTGADPCIDSVFEGLAGPGRWPAWNAPYPFAASVFVGLLPLTLAVAGVREGRRGKLLGLLTVVLLWTALGPTLGADAILGRVPIWSSFRYSEKLIGPLTLVLATLAGLGADAVVERRLAGRRVLAVAATLGLSAVAASLLGASRLPPDVASLADARVARGAWQLGVVAVALGGWLLVRERLGSSLGPIALAVLTWAGMAAASGAALHPGDPALRLRSPGPVLDADAPGPRILTPYKNTAESPGPGVDRLDELGRTRAALGAAAYNVGLRLDSLTYYAAMRPERMAQVDALFGARWGLGARRYGLTHLVLDRPQTASQRSVYGIAIDGARRVESASGPDEVWAVPHREWASFAPEVRVVEDERAGIAAVGRAFVERSDAVVVEAWSDFNVGPGRVLAIQRGLDSLRIEAEADGDGTLVIADAWWPGWDATLDGSSAPVFPADVLVRAVRWPAGRHVLEMRYRPPEVRLGLFVTALGLALAVGWMAILRRLCVKMTGA